METVTIEGVELLSIGTHFAAVGGRTPITEETFASMLAAAADAEVDHAPVKPGHWDERFDGEPAWGWMANLRQVGNKLVADFTDVPKKLAEIVKAAYRRRSVEIDWNVKTPGGKTYPAAIRAVALLGVQMPAVKNLADIASRYSAGAAEVGSTDSLLLIDGIDDPELVSMFAESRADPGTGSDHGNRDAPGGDAMTDAQIRELFGLAADAPITDKLRSAAVLQGAITADPVLGELAKLSDEDRTKVTEYAAAVKAADDAAATAAKAKADQDAAAAAAAAGAGGAGGASTEGAPPVVSIDEGALKTLQEQAAQGATAMQRLEDQEREGDLVAALSAGKIGGDADTLKRWRDAWNRDKATTKSLLAGLPVVFSTVTTELGAATTAMAAGDAAQDASFDAWERQVFGDELGRPQS